MDSFEHKIQMLIDVLYYSNGDADQALQAAMEMNLSAEDIVRAAQIIESQTQQLLAPVTIH